MPTLTQADRRYARREASNGRYAKTLEAREAAYTAALAASDGLPELTGSERQLPWAITLRAEALQAFGSRMSRAADAWTFTVYEAALAAVSTNTACRFWIDARPDRLPDDAGWRTWDDLVNTWVTYAVVILEAAGVRQKLEQVA